MTGVTLPGSWAEKRRHGEYVEAGRGHESAVFHIHDCPRDGHRSAPPTVHYCNWVGSDVQCCACGNTVRLPEQHRGDQS